MDLARKVLENADSKAKKSKMASMVAWLKANPQAEGSAEAAASRGDQRVNYLMQYLIFQNRKSQGKAVTINSTNHVKQEYNEYDWLCEHQIRTVFKSKQTSNTMICSSSVVVVVVVVVVVAQRWWWWWWWW